MSLPYAGCQKCVGPTQPNPTLHPIEQSDQNLSGISLQQSVS